MNCFPCFSSHKSKQSNSENDVPVAQATAPPPPQPQPQPAAAVVDASPSPSPAPPPVNNGTYEKEETNVTENKYNAAKTFTFRELAAATKNFKQECLLGEGGFGRVYKGTLQGGKVVAVKQLDRNGMQGNKEFLVEVLVLSLLHHPNLVHLIGYCADGDQRLLVYEYMPSGSLEDHLLDISEDKKPLDWLARMKIASGAAQGMEYLHEKANPSVVYRDLKSSNIFLDEDFNPKLSDYGLAKLGLGGSKMHVSYGYCAPEYERSGELTLKSDIYSFGVILLELISGRRAIDTTRPTTEQNVVSWARPIFRDPKRFPELADPLLKGKFPERSLNQVVGVAAMCLQEEPSVRPLISDVVAALSFLQDDDALPVPNQLENHYNHGEGNSSDYHKDGDSSESSDDDDDDDDDDGNTTHHQREESKESNSENPKGQVKKTVKWATNSRCRSKAESRGGSTGSSSSDKDPKSRSNSRQNSNRDGGVGSSSSSSDNSDAESEHGNSGQNSRSNSNVGWHDESDGSNLRMQEGSARSNSSIYENSMHYSNAESKDGSVGSHNSES
ncbi:hypothetical protein CsSME_00000088 [Camellia sinensis var. sinensis]